MKTRWRILGGVVILGFLALGTIGWMALGPGSSDFAQGQRVRLADYKGPVPTGVPPQLSSATAITRGAYLARAADCAACHTAKGGVPFAGGRPFKLPFGTLYAPNITPDRETGIGLYSEADFLKAVHKGLGRGGKPLYPAFPYVAYSQLTDTDVLDIRAYLFSLNPVRQAIPANNLRFPFNQRSLMIIWRLLFNRDTRFEPVIGQTPEWNRGAYLVEAAGHCGDCHTPRNLMQAVDNRRKFAGGTVEGWNAYNISSDRLTGIGAWNRQELIGYLSTGHSVGRGTASGPMAEVVDLSLSRLTPSDVAAMATYLASIPPQHARRLPNRLAGPAPAAPKGFGGEPAGKKVFEGACAGCHAWDGSGALVAQAQLTGARAVNDPSAANVAQMVLNGSGASGGRPFMPSFGAAYSDQEIADVANYVTARFGSAPSKVTRKDVAHWRAAN